MGGKLHLRLNIGERPIANKYREGKMKRTLKRELKVLEIAKREANEPSHFVGGTPVPDGGLSDPCLTRGDGLLHCWVHSCAFCKCQHQFLLCEKTFGRLSLWP